MSETSGSATKKARVLNLTPSAAPKGYHYEGEPCMMVDGKLTTRLRKDVEGSREIKYSDLYCRLTGKAVNGKVPVSFVCCIAGCSKPSVNMFVNSHDGVVL
jgi:hypothetical protein